MKDLGTNKTRLLKGFFLVLFLRFGLFAYNKHEV